MRPNLLLFAELGIKRERMVELALLHCPIRGSLRVRQRASEPLERASESVDYAFFVGNIESVGWRVGDKKSVPKADKYTILRRIFHFLETPSPTPHKPQTATISSLLPLYSNRKQP